eukprot:2376303-Rhodomonas_salina.1
MMCIATGYCWTTGCSHYGSATDTTQAWPVGSGYQGWGPVALVLVVGHEQLLGRLLQQQPAQEQQKHHHPAYPEQ